MAEPIISVLIQRTRFWILNKFKSSLCLSAATILVVFARDALENKFAELFGKGIRIDRPSKNNAGKAHLLNTTENPMPN